MSAAFGISTGASGRLAERESPGIQEKNDMLDAIERLIEAARGLGAGAALDVRLQRILAGAETSRPADVMEETSILAALRVVDNRRLGEAERKCIDNAKSIVSRRIETAMKGHRG